MQRTDKVLIGIVAGVVVVVLAAFALLLLRPRPVYVADDTPEHIVHNYLLALQQEDYERAYGYLLPSLSGHPGSVDAFIAQIHERSWAFDLDNDANSFQIDPAVVTGDHATVPVTQRSFYEGGLFGSGSYENRFAFSLSRPDASLGWKISRSSQLWLSCWNDLGGC